MQKKLLYVFGILLLFGGAICFLSYHSLGEYEPIIESKALNEAIDEYEKWVEDGGYTSYKRFPNEKLSLKKYNEAALTQITILANKFGNCLNPSSGSGRSGVLYLRDMARVQELTIKQWLTANKDGDKVAMEKYQLIINVNYDSLEHSILLYKLLLGRTDHNIKGIKGIKRE